MENRKTFKIMMISLCVYMLLSWVIVAGNFQSNNYTNSGFNQFGLFDFLLAPINVFNTFVVSLSLNIDDYVRQFSYGNIIVALISIAIYYGVLNKTDAYYNLVITVRNKFKNKRKALLIITAITYYLVSAFSGLFLILFLFFPFICAVLTKLKFNKETIAFSTIGAMLIGQIGSVYNPSINGIARILFSTEINNYVLPRIILSIILLLIVIAVILFKENQDTDKVVATLLLEEKDTKKLKKESYIPIIIVTLVSTIILFICMYNWYYMFDIKKITNTYNTITNFSVKNYKFMNNIFGISEPFGYWTGFTMSGLLLLSSLVIKFLYKIKFNDMLDNCRKAVKRITPVVFYSIISLSIIVIALNNSDSFIYSIINNIFKINNHIISLLLACIVHNIFINDYFALLSSLSEPIKSIFDIDKLNLSLLIAQVSHGISSLITPFNIYLIAGLTYLNISFKSWFKYIWKIVLLLLLICLIILYVISTFM